MHKLITLRFALPTIVILALVTFAIIALVLFTTHHIPGAAFAWPM